MAHALKLPIIDVLKPAPDHVELILDSPVLAQGQPGQFCHVLTPGMLRRPISFSRLSQATNRVGILLQVVGPGTAWLSERHAGDWLDVMGPLGRGFSPPKANRPWLLVGGGVGIPPIYAALERWQGSHGGSVTVVLGARRHDYVIMQKDFLARGVSPQMATDDGSLGRPGTVIPWVEDWLQTYPDGEIMACGPTPMLAALSTVTAAFPGRVQLALEQRMGCGIGACLACVVPAKPVGPLGPRYRRVCTDGPVFFREELVW